MISFFLLLVLMKILKFNHFPIIVNYQFDAQNMRIGWAESSCDYFSLVKEHGYTSAMQEFEESKEQIQEEDKEEEEQEDEKEEHDQQNAEDEIKEDEENIEQVKHSNNITIPVDDILDNPAIAGAVFGVVFLAGVFCVCKCFGSSKKRRKNKKRRSKENEFGTRSSYRDNFEDEDESSDSEYAYDDDDAYGFDGAEEYGEHKGL